MRLAGKQIRRAIRRHLEADHKLRVQRFDLGSDDLEIHCVFCDSTLVLGGPSVINEIADAVIEGGGKVSKLNLSDSSVRVH